MQSVDLDKVDTSFSPFPITSFHGVSAKESKNRNPLWNAGGVPVIDVSQETAAELDIRFPEWSGAPVWRNTVKCVVNRNAAPHGRNNKA